MKRWIEKARQFKEMNGLKLVLLLIGIALLMFSAVMLYFSKTTIRGFSCLAGIILAELLILYNSSSIK